MKHILLSFILAVFCIAAVAANAAEPQTFVLKNGTKVRGHLMEFNKGVYIIKTPDGAQTRIRAKRIARIITPKKKKEKAKKGKSATNPLGGILASRPTLLQDAMNLKDPKIDKMLKDPDFLQALQEIKDPKKLETDPRTKTFFTHPKIQALLKKTKTRTKLPKPAPAPHK